MDEAQLRAQVEARVAEEKAAAEDRIADLLLRDAEVVKRAEKASAAYYKAAGKDPDRALSPKAAALSRDMLRAVIDVENMGSAISRARERVKLLSEPSVIDKRIEEARRDAGRFDHLRQTRPRTRRTTTGRSRGVPREKADVPKNVQDKIVKLVETSGKGAPWIATQLNEQKVPCPFSEKGWAHYHVRQVYRDVTGITDWKEMRAKHPLGGEKEKKATPRKPAAAAKPAATKRKAPAAKPNGNGNAKKAPSRPESTRGQATPMTKQSQASGTSRGGTGKKPPTTKASSSRSGSTKSGSTTGRRTGRKRK